MKINPNTQIANSGIQNTETKKAEKTKVSGYEGNNESASVSKSNESAKAEISSKARDMAKAKQVASDTPDVREAKIAELKSKIQNKTYNVSADKIADKLVDDHMSMAGA